MPKHDIPSIKLSAIYPLYVQKAERKGRTRAEVDDILCWLTGYDQNGLERQVESKSDLRQFFDGAPRVHPNSALIKGVVCGVRVEDIEDPMVRNVRSLDKLIDELAKGKAMEKILRS